MIPTLETKPRAFLRCVSARRITYNHEIMHEHRTVLELCRPVNQ